MPTDWKSSFVTSATAPGWSRVGGAIQARGLAWSRASLADSFAMNRTALQPSLQYCLQDQVAEPFSAAGIWKGTQGPRQLQSQTPLALQTAAYPAANLASLWTMQMAQQLLFAPQGAPWIVQHSALSGADKADRCQPSGRAGFAGDLAASTLQSMIATAALELAGSEGKGVASRAVDAHDAGTSWSVGARQASSASGSVVGARNGASITQRLLYEAPSAEPVSAPPPPDATILITGGLGGIGRLASRWLRLAGHAGDIVSVGRSGRSASSSAFFVQPTEDASTNLEAAAFTDTSIAADASARIDGALLTALGSVAPLVVLAAAGLQVPASLKALCAATARPVLASKVDATCGLIDAGARPFASFVSFSSLSSIAGFAGQASYGVANAGAEAATAAAVAGGVPAVAVQWGAWADVGMVSRKHALAADRVAALGMLTSAAGLSVLSGVLGGCVGPRSGAVTRLGAAPISYWHHILGHMPGAPPALLEDVASRGLADIVATPSAHVRPDADRPVPSVTNPSPARPADIRALVLGILGAESVDPSAPLGLQGLDSLAALELRQKIQEATGGQVPRVLVDDPAAATLDAVLQELEGMLNGGAVSEQGGVTAEQHAVSRASGDIPKAKNSTSDASPEDSSTASPKEDASMAATLQRLEESMAPKTPLRNPPTSSRTPPPKPSPVRIRVYCLPYAAGVSELVFARYPDSLPSWVEVRPVEIPGRGRLASQPAKESVHELAEYLADTLPLDEAPYALFGTCLGAIVAFELAAELARRACAAGPGAPAPRQPLGVLVAAVAPPQHYARAVMRLYLQRSMRRGEPPPVEEVLGVLAGWRALGKDQLLRAFEAGNFAGVEEMRANDRLFWRVAPLGVADISMAVRYRYDAARSPPLACPLLALDGRLDATIQRGLMRGWRAHTRGSYRHVPVRDGDHYFVAKCHQQVADVVRDFSQGLLARPGASPATAPGQSGAMQSAKRLILAPYHAKEDLMDALADRPGLRRAMSWLFFIALVIIAILRIQIL